MSGFQIEYEGFGDNQKIQEPDKNKVMYRVAEALTRKIEQGDMAPIISVAATGVGKSTDFLHHLYVMNPAFRVICS